MSLRRRDVLICAMVHLAVTIASFAWTFAMVSARFDDASIPETRFEVVTSALVQVLTMPARLIWERWPIALPGVIQWMVILLNSALWGIAAAAIIGLCHHARDAKRTDARMP